MSSQGKKTLHKTIARNKQARRNYEIDDEYEAGLVLRGSEVKSLRDGRASITEAYCKVKNGELWLVGAHVPEYKNAGYAGHEPTRDRKLLLHAHEVKRILARVTEKGYTLVPMELYFCGARIKLQVGLGKGKKMHDKRQDLAKRATDREIARAMKDARHR